LVTNSREKPSPQAIEACIARVMQAEREAQASVESARGHAAAAVAQARGKARAISERAEARLAAARQSVEARIARHQAEADARARALRETLEPAAADEGRLDEALAQVAASLTTGHGP
jgi:regulator of protease activity HflC (stomatin/prohibitin superfamily)